MDLSEISGIFQNIKKNGGFPQMENPQKPIEMDDFGVPLF
jgi:hypothetical protein